MAAFRLRKSAGGSGLRGGDSFQADATFQQPVFRFRKAVGGSALRDGDTFQGAIGVDVVLSGSGHASADGAADTGVMLQHGSPRWALILFGMLTASLGLYLWHRQGKHFGLGETRGKVNRRAAIVSASLLAAIVGMELIINSK